MASINEIHYLMTTARAEHPVASSAIAEFIQAYKQAREDSDDGIRESAAFIARALQEHARGWLDGRRYDYSCWKDSGTSPGYAPIMRKSPSTAVSGLRSSASLISPWRCWSARYNQDCGNCLRLSSGSAFTAC
ncbi:membrane protein [Salmonella enterica]|nr:membrane protein [Salmonella enterica]